VRAPPDPTRAAAAGANGGGRTDNAWEGVGAETQSTPTGSHRCDCKHCRDGVRPNLALPYWPDLADLLERPGVVHQMPSDWYEMVACGLDPITGERAA
jgi:hypothetical protein